MSGLFIGFFSCIQYPNFDWFDAYDLHFNAIHILAAFMTSWSWSLRRNYPRGISRPSLGHDHVEWAVVTFVFKICNVSGEIRAKWTLVITIQKEVTLNNYKYITVLPVANNNNNDKNTSTQYLFIY